MEMDKTSKLQLAESPDSAESSSGGSSPQLCRQIKLETEMHVDEAGLVELNAFSPAAYVTCGGSSGSLTSTPCRRSIKRPCKAEEIEDTIDHYGSESSEDECEDEGAGGEFMSMVQYLELQELLDLEEDAEPSEASTEPAPSSIEECEFRWTSFPSPPLPPLARREVFSSPFGPTGDFRTPYEAFTAIWSRDIIQYIAQETNKYAQFYAEGLFKSGELQPHSRITRWHDTDVDELYVYLAIILSTGHCVKSVLTEYWAKDDIMATPNYARYMGHNRFMLLNTCLHFNDNTTPLGSMTKAEAKRFKISPIITHLNNKFQVLYNLDRNISVDESFTQLGERWLNFKQYRNNKKHSGIRTFEVCEAQSGYLWRFKVYVGREKITPNNCLTGVTPALVSELLTGLENKGHTIWMNKYYNSPKLARFLKSKGFDCAGTLNTNRRGVPDYIKNLGKSDMAIGQISGCTSGDVDILVWRDHNRVAMISTYHGPGVHTSSSGQTKPIVVHDYNVCMGGVDKKDQMLRNYPIERKRTHVWYKKFFRRLLNISVLNAFLMVDKNPRCTNKFTHRSFRQNLIAEILKRHHLKALPPSPPQANTESMPFFTPDHLKHMPEEYGLIPGTSKCERIRRSCAVCHKRVQTYCPACGVALCAVRCHKAHHTPK